MKVIHQAFDAKDSDRSAKELVRILYPDWKAEDIELVRFTEGITNTVGFSFEVGERKRDVEQRREVTERGLTETVVEMLKQDPFGT